MHILLYAFVHYLCFCHFKNVDPCKDHTVLGQQYRRSVPYQAAGTEEDPYICDRYMAEGWYYFSGGQGDEMPTTAPPNFACGTQYPVWLDGTLCQL